jgi:hypothetical protein
LAVCPSDQVNGWLSPSASHEGTLRSAIDAAHCWVRTNKTAQPAIVTLELLR